MSGDIGLTDSISVYATLSFLLLHEYLYQCSNVAYLACIYAEGRDEYTVPTSTYSMYVD